MALQLYLTLICAADGDLGMNMMMMLMVFILASIYSFFNPARVMGIEALQSNGAMVAVMGAGTYNIVANAAGTPFYLLYCLLALDAMASFSSYFQEHSQRIEWNGTLEQPLRVITNPKGDDNDYSRL